MYLELRKSLHQFLSTLSDQINLCNFWNQKFVPQLPLPRVKYIFFDAATALEEMEEVNGAQLSALITFGQTETMFFFL